MLNKTVATNPQMNKRKACHVIVDYIENKSDLRATKTSSEDMNPGFQD